MLNKAGKIMSDRCFIEAIHQKLLLWGEWSARRLDLGLGYAKSSVVDAGGQSVCGSVVPRDVDIGMVHVDRAVMALPDQLRDTVRLYYTRVATQEQLSRQLGISVDTLLRRISRAHGLVKMTLEVRDAIAACKFAGKSV